MNPRNLPEPWLRDMFTEIPPVLRAVAHALELAREDVEYWCGGLSEEEGSVHPAGLPSVAFHVRHISRSLDRLLTYAQSRKLNEAQVAALNSEMNADASLKEALAEFTAAIAASMARIRSVDLALLNELRMVGSKQLPTTVVGLLVHIADHTQRHVGQAVTTAKILIHMRTRSMGIEV